MGFAVSQCPGAGKKVLPGGEARNDQSGISGCDNGDGPLSLRLSTAHPENGGAEDSPPSSASDVHRPQLVRNGFLIKA
jgi:hypothetical protein